MEKQRMPSGPVQLDAYRSLYKFGGVASWIVAGLTLLEVIFFVLFPQPVTVSDWFELFQSNPLLGLLDFWGMELFMYLAFIVVFLALYFALRYANPSWIVIALTLALLGIGIFLATNNPFSMFTLSGQYAVATSIEKATFLAAGQALLANTGQRAVEGFNLGLFLVSTAGLIMSVVMTKGSAFGKSTGYIGILAFALSLLDYLRQFLTTSIMVALPVILLGALFLLSWFILVGLRLWSLGSARKESISR
jgi:hypothetical protein